MDIIEQGESLDATPYQKEFIFPQEPEGTVIALDYKREGVHKGHEYVRAAEWRGVKKFELVRDEPSYLMFQGTILKIPEYSPEGQFIDLWRWHDGVVENGIASTTPVMDITYRIYTRGVLDKPQIITSEKYMYLTGRDVCCGTAPLSEEEAGIMETNTNGEAVTFEERLPDTYNQQLMLAA